MESIRDEHTSVYAYYWGQIIDYQSLAVNFCSSSITTEHWLSQFELDFLDSSCPFRPQLKSYRNIFQKAQSSTEETLDFPLGFRL
jgi:hypothetical protein